MLKRLLSLLLFALLIAGCSSTSFMSEEQIKKELGVSTIPGQENFPEADAVILWETHEVKTEINTNYDFETTETVHVVKKLFKNIESNSIEEIYVNSGEIISGLKARTLQPDGTEVVLGKDDYYTVTGAGAQYELYSEGKLIKFTFPALKKNSIIEYAYSITRERAFLTDQWNIQDVIPKLINKYKLTVPVAVITPKVHGGLGWDWNYNFFNCEKVEPTSFKGTNESIAFEWVMKDIPAFEEEPEMPSPRNYLEYVKFAPHYFKTWSDVSEWYYKKLFEPKISISSKIRQKAAELTQNCSSEVQKIEALYKYVQKIRYIAIDINNSGLVPHSPESIMDNSYGDCKDKSLLLLCLLKSLDIKADPVLVKTSNMGVLSPRFPCWSFNHMITKVKTKDGASYWLDGTAEFCTLGEIPSMDEGVNALVLHEDGTGSIERIPESKCLDNIKDYSVNLDISNNKDGIFNINIKYIGEFNTENRYFFKDKTTEEIIKHCKSLVANDYLNAEFSNCKVTYVDDSVATVSLSFDIKVPGLLQEQQDLLLLNYDPFSLANNSKWLVKDKREFPVDFGFPSKFKKHFTITLPENKFVLKSLPKNENLSDAGIDYKKVYNSSSQRNVSINEELTINNRYISAGSYPLVRRNWEIIKNKSSEKLIFRTN
ncbi:MAG: DUF3857 domain-containing protein [Bacteroidota bacterium]|nr:DUF3857 domain-containing protein [Bacteroidota bacterium]